ncbi:MAG: hypothetical protein WKF96_16650 [Solirubrobacteraceae bacterium]
MKAVATTIAVLAILVAGCGAQSPEEQLRQTWQVTRDVLRERDSAAFCALLSSRAREQVLDSVRRGSIPGASSCESAFAKIFAMLEEKDRRTLELSKLLTVKIDGDTATTIDSTQGDGLSTAWVRVDGRWRIDDVGF